MSAEEFDEIWSFIEQKWKLDIPVYFKNVLKVCGYNNGVTIASIDDDDVKYIEAEVRNGNVVKYFQDIDVGWDEAKVLKDCTMSAKNFVFKMGHRKWLMIVVDFLKKHLKENGPNSFNIEHAAKKKVGKNMKKKSVQPNLGTNQIRNRSSREITNGSNTQIRRVLQPNQPNENENQFLTADLKIQQGILICKAITSLINITPSMYAKVSYKTYNQISESH